MIEITYLCIVSSSVFAFFFLLLEFEAKFTIKTIAAMSSGIITITPAMMQKIAIAGFAVAANSPGALKDSPATANRRMAINVGNIIIKEIKNFIVSGVPFLHSS